MSYITSRIIYLLLGLIIANFRVTDCLGAAAMVSELSADIKSDMVTKGTWTPECPVPLERLRILSFPYYDFDGSLQPDGEIIVMDALAEHTLAIFMELFDRKFPIHIAKRIEFFDGDDDKSMMSNNTSAFNYRKIAGSDVVSIHGYGAAIDINPVQNPFFGHIVDHPVKECALVEICPKSGKDYLNRRNQRAGMVEPVKDIFTNHGFKEWGGDWNTILDLHHFQIPRWLAELLASESSDQAQVLFNLYVSKENITSKAELLSCLG